MGPPKQGNSQVIVSIEEQGSRLPLFLISGLGGEVVGLHALARYLGDDQPVFVLGPPGLDGQEPFLTRVEDIAAYYLREMRIIQPHGPYCLAGYSFGGHAAFEMAQQLHASGDMVALLGFLDSIEWQYLEGLRRSANFRQRWALRLNRLINGRGYYIRLALSSKITKIVYRLFGGIGRPVPQRVRTLQDSNHFAMSLYRPVTYSGHLIIFRSTNRGLGAIAEDDEALGWGGLVPGEIEVQDIPGAHQDMLKEPNVRVLAQKLRACLDRVQVSP